ncbi:MAG: galactose-1-phosphate uridylyltransferase [Candidatus Schekmanbacteria bacterium]|nr:galactose-1-phosphate uridylyltransferase [Candidatus Schekmanbacteria bacterium]
MPELRKDPIIGRWVIIATDRSKRPMDLQVPAPEIRGGFCPFCPGNEDKTPPEIMAYRRNGGKPDSSGWHLRVVPNKFPALQIEGDLDRRGEGMFDRMNGLGAHEVVIESPDHTKSTAGLSEKELEEVLWAYRDRMLDLKKDKRFRYILVFKNHGSAAGASLEHSHSQIIALPIVPKRVSEEIEGSKRYFAYKERCVYCDIVRQELESGVRVIQENRRFIAVSPFTPRFPFETWLMPKTHQSNFEDILKEEIEQLAQILKDLLLRMETVLNCPPFNFLLHTAPINDKDSEYYHWHFEIIPKLTKVAGFEWGTGFYINPTPPEEATKFLREAQIMP